MLYKHYNLQFTNTNSEQTNQFPFVRVLQIIFSEHMHFHMPLQFWLNLSLLASCLADLTDFINTPQLISFAYKKRLRQNVLPCILAMKL